MIRIFKPSYDKQELNAVAEVMKSGWVGLGPKTTEFEKAFASYCAANYCIGLSSCTAALDMALTLLDIKKGDEVIIPTITFVSAAHCVLKREAIPVFVDVENDTLNINLKDLKRKVSQKTKAIIPVHYGGLPVKMDELLNIAKTIPVIEDCAHAVGSLYKGKPVGTLGSIGCFSFHATKNLAMGEGGAVTLETEQLAQRARKLRWFGINLDTWSRSKLNNSYSWEYSVDEIGFKAQMDDIHAAIGLVQLKKIEKANLRRQEIVTMYREGLQDIEQLTMPPAPTSECKSSNHLFVIKAERRNALNLYLAEKKINTGVHYKPLHLHSCYGTQPSLPVAEKVFQKILTLPLYPDLTDDNVLYVIDQIKDFYNG